MSNLKIALPLEDAEWIEVQNESFQNLTKKLQHFEKRHFKFGVIYIAPDQVDEDIIYQNQSISPAFKTFMEQMGTIIELKNFTGFKGGLDVCNDTTGTHSLYDRFFISKDGSISNVGSEESIDMELMYHVAPFLPHTEFEIQQLQKKRHIGIKKHKIIKILFISISKILFYFLGNDIVVIVFKEGDQPFDPKIMTSQFNHIFIVGKNFFFPCLPYISFSFPKSNALEKYI